ncbi:MAG: hypothetical protein AAFS10_25310, partial [Myxococcota bacterium]
ETPSQRRTVSPEHAHRIETLPEALAHQLLRTEELDARHSDHLGRWEHTFGDNYRRGKLWEPEIDRWVQAERVRLEALDVPMAAPWPEAHPFAMCITHDVDAVSTQRTLSERLRKISMTAADPELPHLTTKDKVERAIAVLSGPLRGNNVPVVDTTSTLGACIDLEEAYGIKASYFFTVYPVQTPSRFDCTYAFGDRCLFRSEQVEIRHILRYLVGEGFDVGLHASFLSPTRLEMLKRQKAQVEQASGAPVTTVRQHYLAYTHAQTPVLQDRAGLRADSTLGFNRNIGFRAGTSLPHHHFARAQDKALEMIQLPLVIHDGTVFRSKGLEYDLEYAQQAVGLVLDRIRATHGCATLLFHPEVLVDTSFMQLFRWCIEYGQQHNAWFATLHEIQEWTRARAGALESTF